MERGQGARDEPMRTAVNETLVRLRSAGIELDDDHPPAQLALLLEAVEEFEEAVRAHGGDLMVDQPPAGEDVEPDDPRFVLPVRAADETVPRYTERIRTAARRLGRASEE